MNRRSFLARFVGGLAAITLKLEEIPKAKAWPDLIHKSWPNSYILMMGGNRFGKSECMLAAAKDILYSHLG
jgi:hypothetical protein